MKKNPKLDNMISKLADKVECGHLLSTMDPVGFMEQVIIKIEELESFANSYPELYKKHAGE